MIERSLAEPFKYQKYSISLIYTKLIQSLTIEAENLFVWSPVFVGIGIGIFFAQPSEPSWLVVVGFVFLAVVLLIVSCMSGRGRIVYLAAISCMMAVGVFSAKTRLQIVKSPFLIEKSGPLFITGQVTRVENRSERGLRIYIRTIRIRYEEKDEIGDPVHWPEHIRISVRPELNLLTEGKRSDKSSAKPGNNQPIVGSYIEIKAILFPPPEPVLPGGYDFGRRAYFLQLGAVGYALEPPREIYREISGSGLKSASPGLVQSATNLSETSADTDFKSHVNILTRIFYGIERLRQAISIQIRTQLGPETGPLADALITGNRSGINEPEISYLRKAGLAHILAISGLHMAIVTGALFWWWRAMLALIPMLSHILDIKKVSAILSLIGAACYLFLSGASVSTERAFIMISILFIGIISDRPSLTLRNVAAAALILLLIRPESLEDVGFQMSFAAAAALVSAYDFFRKQDFNFRETVGNGILYKVLGYFSGIAVSTLIASLAVAPFAVFHFHKLTQYGLAANLAALPVLALLVMPAAIATLLFLPIGLETIPLAIMSFGCEIILDVARMVSGWTNSQIIFSQWYTEAFLIVIFGGIVLILCQTGLRLLSLPIILAGLYVSVRTENSIRPQILIERAGQVVAIRDQDGLLATPLTDRGRYSLTKWLEAEGDYRPISEVQNNNLFRCDWSQCTAEIEGYRLVFVKSRQRLNKICKNSDIVIAPFRIGRSCAKSLLIDKSVLRKEGAHAIFIGDANTCDKKISETHKFSCNQFSNKRQSDLDNSGNAKNSDIKILSVRKFRGNWPWNK